MKHTATFVILLLLTGLILGGLATRFYHNASSQQHAHHEGDGYFKMNLGTEPPTLDSAEADDLISITVLTNIMRGLTQYGDHQKIIPAYAQSWERSPDGKKYVFHLRHDGRWSDGQPVTAQNFIYAWRRVLDPKNASPYAFLMFDIHNAQAYYKGQLKDPAMLGIQTPDDYTLVVDLDRPIAYFLQIMAFSISLPQRRDMIEKYGNTFTEAGHYITNGPYKLSQWEHESQIFLKPNRYYWNGMPRNKGIKMFMIPEPNTSLIMYENNELDFAETTSSLPTKEVRRLKTRPDYHHSNLHAISYFGFNTQKAPFTDARVRRAFIQAFDRTFIPKLFQGGEKEITSFISPGLFAYNPNIGLKFDIAKARQELAEAGYPNGKGFPTVEMLYANTTPENRQLAEIAQFQWKHNLGVNVDIKNVEWKVFLKQLDDDPPQIFRIQWFVDYPDPDSFLGVFLSESGNGHIQWKSPQYDALVKQAATELDPKKRLGLYNRAQKELLETTAGIMPLYVLPKSYLLKKNVTGFRLDELNLVKLERVQFTDD